MQREQEILNAAADLFHLRGYHATTVEDIASAVGLKKGSLYHYITGKELLLKTLAEDTIQGYLDDALPIADGGGSVSERLGRVIEAHVRRVCKAPERVTVLVREAHYVPDELASDVRGRTSRYTHLLIDLIAEGVRSGEFADTDPGVAGLMLLGALNWAHRWYQPDGRLTPEQIGRQFSRLFLRGLQRRGD